MSTPKRSPDFRPNPERAVYLTGAIEQSTLDRLTPDILRLQSLNREPITLFIDSPGGSIFHADRLYKLLSAPDQDNSLPCRSITVTTGFAASAAADLLMASHYALAYPHSMILCHGVRQDSSGDPLTHDRALDLPKRLATSNERFALQLASNCILRFIFRVVSLRSEFQQIRAEKGTTDPSDAQCMIAALESRISPALTSLLRDALIRSLENDVLDLHVSKQLHGQDVSNFRAAEFEAAVMKAIIDYELQDHKEPNWSFRKDGLGKIEDKFVLLLDKHAESHQSQVRLLCDRWGEFFLTAEEESELAEVAEEQRSGWLFTKVQDHLRSLWFFFVSLCRLLQEGDYYLSAEEAYWLGLIDEVIGRSDLPSPRIFVEYAPKPDEEN